MKDILIKIYQFITHRLFILMCIFVFMFWILISRLFQLQIVEGEKHLKDFKAKIRKEVAVEGIRGNIYDRYGRPLAKNNFAFSVILEDSVRVKNLNEMLYKLIKIIEGNNDKIINEFPIAYSEEIGFFFKEQSKKRIIRFKEDIFVDGKRGKLNDEQKNISAKDLYQYIKAKKFEISNEYSIDMTLKIMALRYQIYQKRYTSYEPIKIAVNVSNNTAAMIQEKQTIFPNVVIETDPIRVYPYGELFAHIIGYTGRITEDQYEELKNSGYNQFDIVGRTGIEKEMEKYLKGQKGTKSIEVDNYGRRINVVNIKNPTKGDDVYLTIDKDLQQKTSEILVNKLTDIILSKIVVEKTQNKSSKKQISLNEIYCALIDNNFISINKIEKSNKTYQQKLNNIYAKQENILFNELKRLLLSENIKIKYYNENMKIFYDTLIQSMIDKNFLKTDYRDDKIFYEKYKNGETTVKEFLKYCLANNLLNLKQYDSLKTTNSNDEIIKKIIDNEIDIAKKNIHFKKEIYYYIINKEYFSHKDMLLLMIEQDLISADKILIDNLKKNKVHPIDIIKEKISSGEITPQNLALDPSTGSIVVVDVHSGEVLSMVSYPSYDDNKLVNNFNQEYFNKLNHDKTAPLFFRAIKEKTAPGSTFKMISALAGLEEKVITPDEFIYDKGVFEKITKPYPKCWIYSAYHTTHGNVDVRKALEVSCNYFFYEVGYRLSLLPNNNISHIKGLNILKKYAEMFGLGSKTGIELDEYSPQISNKDAVRSAIGQGNHAFTPVQMARYIATLANGGTCYNMNMINKVLSPAGNVIEDKKPQIYKQNHFETENLKAVYEGILRVTSGVHGTVRKVFKDYPIKVAGKTGTAQENKKRDPHALFVGFAPYDNPLIAVSVVIPYGYSSTYSAEIFKDVVSSYFELYSNKKGITIDNEFKY